MDADFPIPVAVSARHAHLSQATVDALFGPGYQLRPAHSLAQKGQFAAQETIILRGPAGHIEAVRVLGPPRAADQVEISRSDAIALGIDAPVRLSGDLAGTPGAFVEGPAGRAPLAGGLIVAQRHLHAAPEDAARLGLRQGDVVAVSIDSDGRDLVFADVVVRIAAGATLELHLDTDEGNAAGVRPGTRCRLYRAAII